MSDLDLFGNVIPPPVKGTRPAGYGGIPGTGPAGETCATCKHAVRRGRYAKCAKAKAMWTHGVRTDIRLRTAACSHWEVETHGV